MATNDTAQLATQVKLFAMIPTSQNTFTDIELISVMMNSILLSDIVPLITAVKEGYLQVTDDVVLSVAVPEVTIPPESTGLRLKDVYFVDAQGNLAHIDMVEKSQIAHTNEFGPFPYTPGFNGLVFYVENNKLIFYPRQTVERNMQITYARRPNKLVHPSEGGKVLSKVPNTITLDNAPATWVTGTVLDIIEPTVPYNLADRNGITIVSKSGFDITVSAADYAKVDVGDYIAGRGEAQFVQYLPVEAYNTLCQGTAVQCLLALNDRGGAEVANAKYQMMKDDLRKILTPRIEDQPKKIINTNSAFRASGMIRYWR